MHFDHSWYYTLVSWIRSSNAYYHPLELAPDSNSDSSETYTIPPTRNVAYRTKVCPLCRSLIFQRPSRIYHFHAIYEPLDIKPGRPKIGTDGEDLVDPWENLFPLKQFSYRLYADDRDVCPDCLGSINSGVCACGLKFSDDDSVDDDDDSDGSGGDGSVVD